MSVGNGSVLQLLRFYCDVTLPTPKCFYYSLISLSVLQPQKLQSLKYFVRVTYVPGTFTRVSPEDRSKNLFRNTAKRLKITRYHNQKTVGPSLKIHGCEKLGAQFLCFQAVPFRCRVLPSFAKGIT